ncbi:MAG: cytidine deaminase [Thermoanaerobaculia bacterium]|nr:cytidine deaminase [Thermoanaerobaculia bacterium]
MDWDRLAAAALEVRGKAYAPYSHFEVGAALLTENDEIVVGCNVENRSYGLTVCAERTAVGSAVAAGYRNFKALAVATSASPPAPPCGMCRETLQEFAPNLPILLTNPQGERRTFVLTDLFPEPFAGP